VYETTRAYTATAVAILLVNGEREGQALHAPSR